ncbi:MAG: amidophosphoribosyltransferase [Candidatus Doudnabacteria bacterium]|nr:amidophosphoribosyltransferase [Candidatus Doudnabacteria bacterium]
MCAVVGVYGTLEAAKCVRRALSAALQHRGQESAGIAVSDGTDIRVKTVLGYVKNLTDETLLELLGYMAIGHTRYSTAGKSRIQEAQPLWTDCLHGQVTVVHNGNFVDQRRERSLMMQLGSKFDTTSDTELFLHLYCRSNRSKLKDRLIEVGKRLQTAFALIVMTQDKLVAMRDPWGFRPLMVGKVGGTTVIASEDCAFRQLQMMTGSRVSELRDVEPGEMIIVDDDGVHSDIVFHADHRLQCVFEHVYFSRPDSKTFGLHVEQVRRNLGRSLASVRKIEADIVVPIPNSGIHAGIGYSEASGIPIEWALVRNQYVGRTFIAPIQSDRENSVEEKLLPIVHLMRGRRVILVDDSIVRGTTMHKIVSMVRNIGEAKEVHVVISCPPSISPCFYGVDTPRRKELLAVSHADEICEVIQADTLTYNTLPNLLAAVAPHQDLFCTSCYTNKHPVLEMLGLNQDGLPERRRTVIPLKPSQG